MSLQVVLEAEAQATGVAGEGFLSGVDYLVLQQPHPALEGLVALAALVRPLVRVGALVGTEIAGGGEVLPAGLAGERPSASVDGLVLPQAFLPDEAFPTDVTHERLDFSV